MPFYGLNVCVPPSSHEKNSYIEALNLACLFRDGTSEKVIKGKRGHKGGAVIR